VVVSGADHDPVRLQARLCGCLRSNVGHKGSIYVLKVGAHNGECTAITGDEQRGGLKGIVNARGQLVAAGPSR